MIDSPYVMGSTRIIYIRIEPIKIPLTFETRRCNALLNLVSGIYLQKIILNKHLCSLWFYAYV